MKAWTRAAAVAASAALSIAGLVGTAQANPAPTRPAPAHTAAPAMVRPDINRVTCGSRTDWLRIFSNATTCWANPGTTYVTLYNVYEVCGGNNSGYVRTTTWGVQSFKAHACVLWPAGQSTTVTQITIYA